MVDIDLPLDEIISKQKIGKKLNRNGPQSRPAPRPAPLMRRQTTVTTLSTVMKAKTTTDARSTIISLKRKNMVDARNLLGKISQKMDARTKLSAGAKPGISSRVGVKVVKPKEPTDMRQKLNKNKGANNAGQHIKSAQGQQSSVGANGTFSRTAGTNKLVRTVQTKPAPVRAPVKKVAPKPAPVRRVQQQPVQQVKTIYVNPQPVRQVARPVKRVQQMPVQRVQVRQQPAYRPVRQTVVYQQPQIVYADEPIQEYYDDGMDDVMDDQYVDQMDGNVMYEDDQFIDDGGDMYGPPMPQPLMRSQSMRVVQQRPRMMQNQQQQFVQQQPMQQPRQQQRFMQQQQMSNNNQQFVQQSNNMNGNMDNGMDYQFVQQPMQRQNLGNMFVSQQQQNQGYSNNNQGMMMQQRPQQNFNNQQQSQRYVQQSPRNNVVQQQQSSRFVQQSPQQARISRFGNNKPQPQQRSQQQSRPVQQKRVVQQTSSRNVQQSRTVAREQPARSVQQRTSIKSPAAKKVIGTRVSVTNLHAVATADDIEELFENIGKVTSAKMAAKGSVVVVFKSTADAQKSVEVYHNRKLDGLPMQVKIIGQVFEK